jgi:hypothetical protein
LLHHRDEFVGSISLCSSERDEFSKLFDDNGSPRASRNDYRSTPTHFDKAFVSKKTKSPQHCIGVYVENLCQVLRLWNALSRHRLPISDCASYFGCNLLMKQSQFAPINLSKGNL